MKARSVTIEKDNVYAVLRVAVKQRQYAIVRHYLDYIDQHQLPRPSNLCSAVIVNKDIKMLKLLIDNKVSMPSYIYCSAVTWKDSDFLTYLFEHTVPGKDATNPYGKMPLQVAAESNQWKCVDVYLRYMDSAKFDQYNLGYVLFIAVKRGLPNSFLHRILSKNPSLAWNGCLSGNTVLHLAAEYGNVDLVNMLLCAGANPNDKNKRCQTPIKLAIENGHWDCVHAFAESHQSDTERFLFDVQAFINEYNKGLYNRSCTTKRFVTRLQLSCKNISLTQDEQVAEVKAAIADFTKQYQPSNKEKRSIRLLKSYGLFIAPSESANNNQVIRQRLSVL